MDISPKDGGFAEFKVVCTGHVGFVRIAFRNIISNTWPGKAFLLTMVGNWFKI